MKEIKLTRGLVAIVDDADYEWLNQWKWNANKQNNRFYAIRGEYPAGRYGKGVFILMHRFILGVTDRSVIVDHKDNDPLNNRRDNLRIATRSQNNCNVGLRKNKVSKYKGVSKLRDKWQAAISKNKKTFYIGIYENEVDAAIAYNERAKELHGEFALLNKIA